MFRRLVIGFLSQPLTARVIDLAVDLDLGWARPVRRPKDVAAAAPEDDLWMW